jgi:hypothetical protein
LKLCTAMAIIGIALRGGLGIGTGLGIRHEVKK